jgi:hypothetical protein
MQVVKRIGNKRKPVPAALAANPDAARPKNVAMKRRGRVPSPHTEYGPYAYTEISGNQGANWVMISQPMVVQLELGGWIKRNENGLYVLVEFVQGFLRYREELQHRRRTRASAATRLQEARALAIELRIARDSGDVVQMSEAIGLVQSIAGATRAEFGSLPSRVTRDLEQRVIIEKEVNQSLNRLADKLANEISNIESSGEGYPGGADEDDPIGPGKA